MITALLITSLALTPGLPSGAVLQGEERRGAVLVRLDGAPTLSWQACAAACSYQQACQAWTHYAFPARCTLHNAPLNPRPFPGAVTGLSASLADRIERASERAPSDRERQALGGVARTRADDGQTLPREAQSQLFPER